MRKVYEHTAYWKAKKALETNALLAFSQKEVEKCWKLICARDERRKHDIAQQEAAQMVHYFQTLYDKGDKLSSLLNPVYRHLRKIQRSSYYEAETRRRRELAVKRRKQGRHTTLNSEPTPSQILEAWNRRKESKERMIHLGSLLLDLECYVDRSFRFDEKGNIIARAGGVRGWINYNLPELEPHYKSLMSYKAMARKLRQAASLPEPYPTERLITEVPAHDIVQEILSGPKVTFASILRVLDKHLSPKKVMESILEEGRRSSNSKELQGSSIYPVSSKPRESKTVVRKRRT